MPDSLEFFAVDTNSLPWEKRENPHLPAPIFRKVLHTDPETGVGDVTVLLVSNKPFSIHYTS